MTEAASASWLRRSFGGLAQAPARFPLTLAACAAWVALTILVAQRIDTFDGDWVDQASVFLLLAVFATLDIKLIAESRGWGAIIWLAASAVALGGLAWLIFGGGHGGDIWESPAFLFLLPGLLGLMVVAPFLDRRAVNQAIWLFNLKSWTSAAFGLTVAVVLALGLSAAFTAMETLFGMNLPYQIWSDTWIVCLGLIWPWQTLAGVPGGLATPPAEEDYCPRWASYLISWLLVPLALAYLLLLFVFTAKILIQWELPRGQIGWLVAGFAGFGVAVWLTAWPLRNTGNRLLRLFHRFFPPALAVPVGLLATGTGARIADYGITENRYGLVVLTLWLAGIGLYYALARAPRIAVAPASVAVLLILAAFGPWGASAISLRSQIGQLRLLLEDTGRLVDGRIKGEKAPVDTEQAKRISAVIDYLDSGPRAAALNAFLTDAGVAVEAKDDSEAILARMGLDYVSEWYDPHLFSFSSDDRESFSVAGFDVAVQNNNYDSEAGTTIEGGGRSYSVVLKDGVVTVAAGDRPSAVARLDLAELAAQLPVDFDEADEATKRKLMTLVAQAPGLRVRVYVRFIGGQRNPDGTLRISGANLLVLAGKGP